MLAALSQDNTPMKRARHSLALICSLLLAATCSFPASAHKAKKPAAPSKEAKTLDKAQLAFQRDLVSVLAPRADAMPLLGAALLARPLFNQPPANSFHSLIGRAAMAEGAGAAVTWVRLADCDAKAAACPNDSALEQLQTQAPDNAAVWLLKLGVDTRNMKPDAAREDLARAAASKLYDDYAGTSLQALATSVGILPPPADTLDPAHAAGAIGMQTVMAYGIATTQPQPGLQITAKLCESAISDASIKADCLKLGKLLEWGSSPLARSLGLHLREVLADDPAQQQDAKQARTALVFQVESFSALLSRARDDASVAQQLLALARNGGTEMSVVLAALRNANMPTDPPPGWTPDKQG